MSHQNAPDPDCPDGDIAALGTLIVPRSRDIGAFDVQRVLPSAKRRLVGPFIFFDQFGPAEFSEGQGMDVRPHPHIGLATVTYVFQGGIVHKDSLGNDLEITPGAVNWMVAGRGISHSERTAPERRRRGQRIYGIQTWVALPERHEDTAPSFEHVGKSALPLIEDEGKSLRLILGSAYGERAPVNVYSDMFYADVMLEPGAKLPLPDDHEERAIHVVEGSVEVNGVGFEKGRMLVFKPGERVTVIAREPSRLMLLGGETMDGPRHIWWNFVSSSKDKIEHAKEEWRRGNWDDGLFSLPPGDDDEHIPLPDR